MTQYAHVDVILHCGCSIDSNNIKKFAMDMRDQNGWDVATSKGISVSHCASRSKYTIYVRRGSLNKLK